MNKLYSIATIVLSAMAGFLIFTPLSTMTGLPGYMPILGLILGGLMGYRKKNNRAFLYVSGVSVLILSTVITFNMF